MILRVRRSGGIGAMLRRVRVVVDGREVAGLQSGDEATVELGAGPHVLVCHLDWARSRPLVVEGDEVAVEISVPFRVGHRAFIRGAITARVV